MKDLCWQILSCNCQQMDTSGSIHGRVELRLGWPLVHGELAIPFCLSYPSFCLIPYPLSYPLSTVLSLFVSSLIHYLITLFVYLIPFCLIPYPLSYPFLSTILSLFLSILSLFVSSLIPFCLLSYPSFCLSYPSFCLIPYPLSYPSFCLSYPFLSHQDIATILSLFGFSAGELTKERVS